MKISFQALCYYAVLAGLTFFMMTGCEEKSDDNNNVIPDTTQNGDTLEIPAGWNKVGDLNANNMIWSLASDGAGNIYAAGYFTNSSGFCYVAKWNGITWSELGNLNANGGIFSITATPGGQVYAVGLFTNGATPSGGQNYVARWNGSSWADIGGGGGYSLVCDAAGNLYKAPYKWNGTIWDTLCQTCPYSMGTAYSVATNAGGSIQYVAGDIAYPNGYRYVAKCDGSNCWSELGHLNANANIQAVVTDPAGGVYAAGYFTNGSLPTTGNNYVAKWDGTSWSDLGGLNANDDIYFLAYDPVHGYLFASGYFTNSQGNSYVAKWNGVTWSDLGNMKLAPTPIMVDANGILYSVVASADGKKFTVVSYN